MGLTSSTIYFSTPGRYARALLQTVDHNLKSDFDKIITILNKDYLAKFLLSSICLHKKHLVNFMDEIRVELDFDYRFVNFLKLLIVNNRLSIIDEIYRCYITLWNMENNIRVVDIVSAYELSEEDSIKIQKMLAQFFPEKLDVLYKIDPSLLGGVLIESENLRMDTTVVAQIHALKHHLSAL